MCISDEINIDNKKDGKIMKKKNLYLLSFFTILVTSSACAPIISGSMNASLTEDDVIRKTAGYFDTDPEELEIKNINKELLYTTYKTTYKGTLYNCRIYYGAVSCLRPGEY